MRWVWIFLWIVLVVVQLLTIGMRQLESPGLTTGSLPVDDGLLELARQTNKKWKDIGVTRDNPDPSDGPGSQAGDFGIADWILQLSDIQEQFSRKGTEMHLLNDLEKWISLESNHSGLEGRETYVKGLLTWLAPFLSGPDNQGLCRVRLEPGSKTTFPDLYFELTGKPGKMADLLLESCGAPGNWHIREMELICKDHLDTSWWMQGNCAYEPDGTI